MPDFPSSGEDWSIIRWWRRHPRPGLLWVEVEIGLGGPGDWPSRTSHRRIDAVHFPGHPDRTVREWGLGSTGFAEAIPGSEAEIVEAKKSLNFAVVGQCIAGIDMFSRAYPRHGLLVPVVVVRGVPDAALAWVCRRRGIQLDTAPENEVQQLRRQVRLPELASNSRPATPGRTLDQDDPRWQNHSGASVNHTDPPEWNEDTDLELAVEVYGCLPDRTRVFHDLLVDHPGCMLSLNDICDAAPAGSRTPMPWPVLSTATGSRAGTQIGGSPSTGGITTPPTMR